MADKPTPASVVTLVDRLMYGREHLQTPGWLRDPERLAQEANVTTHLITDSYVARQLALLIGPDRLPKSMRKREQDAFQEVLLLGYFLDLALRDAGYDPEAL